jgi:PIN domain nuclease of toxin-antitoxin system
LTVLDAYALLGYLLDTSLAELVEPLLREDNPATISALNLAEVVDRLVRLTGQSESMVLDRIESLLDTGISVEPIDLRLGIQAGALRARHYRKRDSDVSMADCVACVTAIGLRLPLATADPCLAAVARTEGVAIIPLPDSRGRLP